MINLLKKFKLIFVLVFAFIVTSLLINNVFLGNSPRINNNKIAKFIDSARNFISSYTIANNQKPTDVQNATLENLEKLPITTLNQIGTGVYAKEDIENDIIYIRINKDAEWVERIVNYEGREMKIRFPKGSLNNQ